jgi:hypothetical protein
VVALVATSAAPAWADGLVPPVPVGSRTPAPEQGDDSGPIGDILDTAGDLVDDVTGAFGKTEDGRNASLLRILLGFAVTSGIKYAVGGLGPARLLGMLGGLSPAAGIPAMIGLSFVEAGISITAFQMIAGIERDERQFLAFMLAAGATTLVTPLIVGSLGPVGATLLTNAARLLLFNLIARRQGEKLSLGVVSLNLDGIDSRARAEVLPGDRPLATIDGSLVELKRQVDDSYDRLLTRAARGEPVGDEMLARYEGTRASLDRAMRAALASAAR